MITTGHEGQASRRSFTMASRLVLYSWIGTLCLHAGLINKEIKELHGTQDKINKSIKIKIK
jgi:hypothetical protein